MSARWTLILRTACGATSAHEWRGGRPPHFYRVPLMRRPSADFRSKTEPQSLTARDFELITTQLDEDDRSVAWYREVLR